MATRGGGMATERARAFWLARDRLPEDGDAKAVAGAGAEVNGGGAHYSTLGRQVNGCERPAPWDAHAWAGLYCTLRDKRRGRSRTPGGSGSTPPAVVHRPPPRSLTPSSLTSSSGRTTPTLSPSHGPLFRMASRTTSEEVLSVCSDSSRTSVSHSSHRFRTTCWMEPRPVPVHYSSTVYMKVGSTKKRYVEEVTFQTRLVPRRFSESMTTATTIPSRRFTSVLEIQCLAPAVHIINLDDHQLNGLNGMADEHEA
ncbi:hypothetical protein R5R35_000800 [Gryllus longicercus]|uniref:Uncharacterized protein n=1 Tax=Gryllus longicercus TaxID=2509291 RepID=A0AAN9VUL7_9ORTH